MSLSDPPIEELLAEGNAIRKRVIEKVGSEDGKWVIPGITRSKEKFLGCLVLPVERISDIQRVRHAIEQILRELSEQEKMPVQIFEVGKSAAF